MVSVDGFFNKQQTCFCYFLIDAGDINADATCLCIVLPVLCCHCCDDQCCDGQCCFAGLAAAALTGALHSRPEHFIVQHIRK